MLIDKILKSGQSLEKFQQQPLETSIFKHSDQQLVPNFFKQHSINQTHKIKYFLNDPQANIRVFYFQYLKLCFESKTSDPKFYITRIEDLILNQDFQFILEEQLPQQQVKKIDLQYKRLILEFFQYVQQDEKSVEQALCLFPIMDKVLVSFFRTLLISMDLAQNYSTKIQASSFYEFLISYFGIQTQSFDYCIKFKDTDIYVYQEKTSLVFIAYSLEKSNGNTEKQNESQIQDCSVLQGSGPDFFLRVFGKQERERLQNRQFQQQQSKTQQINQRKRETRPSQNCEFTLKNFLFQELQKQELQKKVMKHARTSSGSIQPPSDTQLDKRVSTEIVDFNTKVHWNNLEDIQDDETIHLNNSNKNLDQQSIEKISSQSNFIDIFKKQQQSKRIEKFSYKIQRIQTQPTAEKKYKFNQKFENSNKNDQSILTFNNQVNKQNEFIPTTYKPFQKKILSFSNKKLTSKKKDKKVDYQTNQLQRLKQKINITQEFTKTFILKQLREPYLMSVAKMKQRSRISRDNFLKTWITQA